MITIRAIPLANNPNDREDFLRSLHAHAAVEGSYEIIGPHDAPLFNSRVVISLPDNILVLGKDWDVYVRYWLDHEKPIDLHFIRRRFAPQTRAGEAEFQHIDVEYKVVTT